MGTNYESVLVTTRGKTISLWNAGEGQYRKKPTEKQLEDEKRRCVGAKCSNTIVIYSL
jgi:hypothetical protein